MDIAELKRLAEAAGCARWSLTVHTGADDDFDAEADDWTISHGGRQLVACEQSGIRKAEFVRYVAAANPAAVLELIAEIDRLRRIESAARNLIAQRGRHNTEIAYRRLAEEMKGE